MIKKFEQFIDDDFDDFQDEEYDDFTPADVGKYAKATARNINYEQYVRIGRIININTVPHAVVFAKYRSDLGEKDLGQNIPGSIVLMIMRKDNIQIISDEEAKRVLTENEMEEYDIWLEEYQLHWAAEDYNL